MQFYLNQNINQMYNSNTFDIHLEVLQFIRIVTQ